MEGIARTANPHAKGSTPRAIILCIRKSGCTSQGRLDHALGIYYEQFDGKQRNSHLLSHKIGNRFYRLQERLIATEGTFSAAMQQEAREMLTEHQVALQGRWWPECADIV